jgi:homocitrate synthase NifV
VLSLSIPTSDLHINKRLRKDRDWVRSTLTVSVKAAKFLGVQKVSVGFEDATRADVAFLRELAEIAEQSGAWRIRLADTVGVATPGTIGELVQAVLSRVGIAIGVHCHNDFGMATANSIAALEAGALWVDATVLGLGERAGNCRLEELVGYFGLMQEVTKYHPDQLQDLCRYLSDVTGSPIAGNHPIVGRDIFTCESGLHQHGLTVHPTTYEPYAPDLVGGSRTLRFGSKTGRRAVLLQLARKGIGLNEAQAARLLSGLRSRKETVSEEQLQQLAALLDQ